MPSLFEDVSFDDFYKLYPRKVAKGMACKAWQKVSAADRPLLMRRLQKFIDVDWKGTEVRFVPYPATWLNARRWEDEIRDVSQLPDGRHDKDVIGQLGVSPVQPHLSGVRNYPAPTEEERLEGIRILRECVEKLTANDLRLHLRAKALIRKKERL
jgi:hypothetical protein